MLAETCTPDALVASFLPRERWRPFPPARSRNEWSSLADDPRQHERVRHLVREGEAAMAEPWPQLRATQYMAFLRSDSRALFEKPYFRRRGLLARLVLAECIEYKGRFTDAIIDALWSILEEATWVSCAHNRADDTAREHNLLARHDSTVVDLFSAETAMACSEALYLLGTELDSVTPVVGDRVRHEVIRRVIAPVEDGEEQWWFSGQNNWTPWCASNILGSAMYCIDDVGRVAAIASKLAVYNDRFLATYGEDGGCDEGPMYWGVAAGALFMFLEHLYSRSGGRLDWYHAPLVQAMADYVTKAHLARDCFANFADSSPRLGFKRMLYRFGERVGNPRLMNLALLSSRRWRPDDPVQPPIALGGLGGALMEGLRELFWVPPDARPSPQEHPLTSWLPDIQVAVVRERTEDARGLCLAAKAGHNGENHNHNDIGQFIVLSDGEPAIVDLGSLAYTRVTFSPRRYTLFFTRSRGHCVPLVNGCEQHEGSEYRARRVRFTQTQGTQTLSMDLAGAYPAEAGLSRLSREIIFAPRSTAPITVRDTFVFSSGPGEIVLPLNTPHRAAPGERGTVVLDMPGHDLLIRYDPDTVAVAFEEVTDEELKVRWGGYLQQILFRCAGTGLAGELTVTVHRASR